MYSGDAPLLVVCSDLQHVYAACRVAAVKLELLARWLIGNTERCAVSALVRLRREVDDVRHCTPQDIAQFMIIAVLAGFFWLRKGGNNTVAGAQQVTGLLFFELLFLSLRALFTALFTFPSDFKMVRPYLPLGVVRTLRHILLLFAL